MPERIDPMRAAQANMRQPTIKRFYKEAQVREAEGGGFELTLDGRPARTPGKNRLAAASRALMGLVAEEWARQGDTVDPADMPVTRLLNSAIDGVARTMDETRAEIARYAGSDLALLPGGGARDAGGAPAPGFRSRSRLGGGNARRAVQPGGRRRPCRAAAGGACRGQRRARRGRRPGGAGCAQRHHEPHRLGAAGARGSARRARRRRGVGGRPCRRGLPERAMGRRRGGWGAARGALARDGGGGEGAGGVRGL